MVFNASKNTEYIMNHWENPQLFRENKEPVHAALMPYPDSAAALHDACLFAQSPQHGLYVTCPFYQSLNGSWTFTWVNHPDKVPAEFYSSSFDSNDWISSPSLLVWKCMDMGFLSTRMLIILLCQNAQCVLKTPIRPIWKSRTYRMPFIWR